MVKNYELYVILDATAAADARTNEIAKIESMIKEDFGADKVKVNDQGSKKLAYPIKKARLGHYVLFSFDLPVENSARVAGFEKKLNVSDFVTRYLLTDMTEHNELVSKQSLNKKTEVKNHQDLNKGRITTKQDVLKHLGYKTVDYKDVELLTQFVSPYHKIFNRKRVGNSAKTQRMISQAVKRARHMALMAFTPKHEA